MINKLTERILRMFRRLDYNIVVINDPNLSQIEYRNADHIPEVGEVIGVPVQCNKHSKGTSYLTVRNVFYPANELPRILVDRNEIRQKHAKRSNYSI